MTEWATGQQLGPFVLLAHVGTGGMGEVWKARDARLDRVVAIKRLKAHHSQRFEQEARSIAALNHPHICQIYDVGPDYLVLEYVEGAPLRGPLPSEEAVRLGLQIASALEEAHGRNILHRDLKPANILVTAKGSVKLLDFGLAKLLTASDSDATRTLEGTVMGTVAYMAPEQAEGKPLDARSDIFSFGAVLYEMLSGCKAFSGGSTAQVMSAVLRDQPRPMEAPAVLERIVRKCLAKEAGQRYQTVAELRTALEQVSQAPHQDQSSIAVLPFSNMSADKDQEYFSDGLAEEIINALAHMPGIKVTARTSAFAFRGKELDIRKVADTLGVKTVLEGSVRRAGNRIRVTAQLINAADGYHLWSERYDRDLTDVFAVQDEIATAIAQALQVKLTPAAAVQAPARHKPQLGAFEAVLQGRQYQHRFPDLETFQRVKAHYERAITLDPQYAVPHAELGMYFVGLAALGPRPAREMMPMARAQAQRALELDGTLPDAHGMLGVVACIYDYDWAAGERHFRLAFAHGAVSPMIRCFYGSFYLVPTGRAMEAVRLMEEALDADPLNQLFRSLRATTLMVAGEFAEAARQARLVLEFDPSNSPAYVTLAFAALSRGQIDEGLAMAGKAFELAAWFPPARGLYAGLLARNGDRTRGEEILRDPTVPGHAAAVTRMMYHAVCGEADQGAKWAEKAIEDRHPAIAGVLRGPLGKVLRTSPRWPGLMRMLNLPEGE